MAVLLGPLETVLVLLSALTANGSPVLLRGHGHPLDFNHVFIDGCPILGKGKTFEGLALGTLFGSTIAYLISGLTGQQFIFYAGTLAAVGALLGDVVAAFIKRRIGLERGAPAPLLDQLDFYSGAIVATTLAGYLVEPITAVALGIVVPLLHRATNYAAYRLGLKNVPW